jgi:hypothetical protein
VLLNDRIARGPDGQFRSRWIFLPPAELVQQLNRARRGDRPLNFAAQATDC